MPTIAVSLTNATVVDIKADQSLVDGKSYLIQARGGNILMSEQASAPTIGSTPTHLLENDGAPWTYIVRSAKRFLPGLNSSHAF